MRFVGVTVLVMMLRSTRIKMSEEYYEEPVEEEEAGQLMADKEKNMGHDQSSLTGTEEKVELDCADSATEQTAHVSCCMKMEVQSISCPFPCVSCVSVLAATHRVTPCGLIRCVYCPQPMGGMGAPQSRHDGEVADECDEEDEDCRGRRRLEEREVEGQVDEEEEDECDGKPCPRDADAAMPELGGDDEKEPVCSD